MGIKLENIEGLTPEQRAAIKKQHGEDVNETIRKRLAKEKESADTEAKLARLKELEEKAEADKLSAEENVLIAKADEQLSKDGVKQLEAFKELKSYDKFVKATEEERLTMIKDLKKSKPQLFVAKTNVGRDLLGLQGASLDGGTTETKVKVY